MNVANGPGWWGKVLYRIQLITLEGMIRLEITPFCKPQPKQWIELLNTTLMGSITTEES